MSRPAPTDRAVPAAEPDTTDPAGTTGATGLGRAARRDGELEVRRSTAPAAPVGAVPPSLDWRFLLPRTGLGRVGVLGVGRSGQVALAGCASRVVDLDLDPEAACDVVVLVAPDLSQVARALAVLAPGGSVWIESTARRRRRQVAAALERAGCTVARWWVRPGVEPRCFVTLDRPRAAATVLRTVAGRHRRATPESWFAGSGLARRWATDVALLATAPDRPATPVRHPVAAPDATAPLDALVTPRFARSKAVIGVTTTADGRALQRVVKVTRDPADDRLVRHEAAALDHVVARSDLVGGVPGNHRLAHHGGRLTLVEDAAPGRPLDRRLVRRDPEGALDAAVRWVERLPRAAPSPLLTDGRSRSLLRASLGEIARLEGRHREPRLDHVRRAARLLQHLARTTLPVVTEHGDLSHPNLFLRPDGELLVIDWEAARPAGLPLHDLTFLVAYLAESADRPRDTAGIVGANRRALGPDGWARTRLDGHLDALGIPRTLGPLLELACWTRALADLACTPLVLNRPEPHRVEALWISAITHAEDRYR